MIEIELGDRRIQIPKIRGTWILAAALALTAISGALTCVYTIEAEEEGIVLRFGKFIDTVPPGLHFKLPFGIDRVEKVAVLRQQEQEYGFGTGGGTNPSQASKRSEQEQEKKMVTGDLNAALVTWVIQYKIGNPEKYLFNVRNADETLRDASESIMREVVGDRSVDEVITVGRSEIESECLTKLQELVNAYEMGITIDQVQLKDAKPPKQVEASFNEVNQAQQEKEQSINIANGQKNKEIPKARGEAAGIVSEAEGYAAQRVNEAEGDAAKFISIFTEYMKAPEVTRRRMYLETMQKALPKLGQKIIIDEEATQVLPLLQLNQEAKSNE